MIEKLNGYRLILIYLLHFLLIMVAFVLISLSGASTKVYAGINNIKIEPTIEFATDTVKIYDVVEQMPEIEGGLKEVYKNIQYPQLALSRGIEGRVFIKFVVDTNGKVKNPEIIRDIGGGCGKAAVEAIKKVKFKPGRHEGQAVNVYFTLPFDFKIK